MIQIAQLCSIISLRPHISVINVSTPSGVRGSQYRVAMENVHPSKTVYSNCKNLHFFVGGRFPKFKYQNLKLGCEIHSQEWWAPCGWKNLRELNFHMENGSQEAQKRPNRYNHMSKSACQNFFVHYCDCFFFVIVGGTFLGLGEITQTHARRIRMSTTCTFCVFSVYSPRT